jgi:hypothetical protein
MVGFLALSVAGCDPMLERRYMDEGAGVNLYTTDQANQAALQDEYFRLICAQAGGSCGDYVTLVQAGMNDIDQRCDGYLTWLDARRRDKEPFLAELAAITSATHDIMTVTGASPKSLNIVTSVFGLAAITYTQWNSRLLISIEQSTVQEVVYNSQQEYRDKIKTWPVPDRPTAVYLLRNYLRVCMPISIEANINTTTRLVKRGAMEAAKQNLVVATTTPTPAMITRIRSVTSQLETPRKSAPRDQGNLVKQDMSLKNIDKVLTTLCQPSANNLGSADSPARKALKKFLTDHKFPESSVIDPNVWSEIFPFLNKPAQCPSQNG